MKDLESNLIFNPEKKSDSDLESCKEITGKLTPILYVEFHFQLKSTLKRIIANRGSGYKSRSLMGWN